MTEEDRISRDDVLMLTAGLWAMRSTCSKSKRNGAVISRGGRIVSVGYNGSPPGLPHCTEVGCLEGEDGGCIRTTHAEANSIVMAAKLGISTEGATIHCTTSPCFTCSKLIVGAGIIRVVYRNLYRDQSGIELLKACKVEVVHHDPTVE